MATLDIKDGAGNPKKLRTDTPATDEHIPHHILVNASDTIIGVSGSPIHVTTGVNADYDTGAGTVNLPFVGLALPASGGPVAGGTSTNPLNVTFSSMPTADYDSGAGTQNVSMVGIALPASGGAVAGGTAANPLNVTNSAVGATTDGESASGDGTLIAIAKRLRTLLGGLLGVTPQMSSAGHIDAQTNATGTNWTAFGSQACKQVLISNQTGVSLEVRHGGSGVGVRIPTGAMMPFYGLTNANQLEIRRVDTSNTQVTVQARWES